MSRVLSLVAVAARIDYFLRSCVERSMGNEKSRPSGSSKASQIAASVGVGKRGPGVKELVERAQKTGVLKASNAGLKEIPGQMAELAGFLRNLDLSSNRIAFIPPFLGDFASLKQLHLDNNKIADVADELGSLKKLDTLTLAGNSISRLPDSLISCLCLKTINLAGNALVTFPLPLCHLPALESADLTGNRLTGLPDEVGTCRAVELNLNRNQLSKLNADALAKTPRLKVLRVEENCLALAEFSAELLANSKVSLLSVEGNLFPERELREAAGYDAFQEKYTASRKKMF